MVSRPYYAPKRGIYINDFTVQSQKLIKESFIRGKHKGMKKCLNFFVVSNKRETKEKKIKSLMPVVNNYRVQKVTQNCFKVLDLKVSNCVL